MHIVEPTAPCVQMIAIRLKGGLSSDPIKISPQKFASITQGACCDLTRNAPAAPESAKPRRQIRPRHPRQLNHILGLTAMRLEGFKEKYGNRNRFES
jgi:hypothetical protein